MRILGSIALYITIIISLYTAYSFYVGNKARKGEEKQRAGSNGMIWQLGSVSFASLVLLIAFIKSDFTFHYVANYSSREMSLFYKLSAFWAGHEGSLLFWLWMLTIFSAVLALSNLKNINRLTSIALYVTNYVQLFLIATILIANDPFQPALAEIANGAGMNPLLMHWAMVLHPPTLFMGYAGLTIPFAFAIAALIDRNSSSEWVDLSHKWTLFAWLFLTLGIFLGALWAYVVLGWGGYWAWDPVENASILPWFTGTALLHAFTMYRRRGGMKLWATSLASFSFVMCIMATFITRSGLIESVHAFPDLRLDLTILFGGIMLFVAFLTIYLSLTRKKEFEAKETFNDFFSRYFTYYLNNLALVTFSVIVLCATVIPPLLGRKVGPEFYNSLAEPLGLLYLLLITLCPYFGWAKTDKKKLVKQLIAPAIVAAIAAVPIYMHWGSKPMGFITIVTAVFSAASIFTLFYILASTRAKNTGNSFLSSLFGLFKHSRSLVGGYVSHLGIAVMIFGIAGSMLYVQQFPISLKNEPGQSFSVSNYKLEFKGIAASEEPGSKYVYDAVFDMRDTSKGNKFVREMKPRFIYHGSKQTQTVEADIHYEPFRDIFVVFNGSDNNGKTLSIDIHINPLVSYVWLGNFILVIGTMIAMWPRRVIPVTERAEEEDKPKKKPSKGKKVAAGVN